MPSGDQQAGPSGAGSQHLGKSVEESEDLFQTGIECIRRNDLEMAADILYQVLNARTARYGDLAAECASAYFRYGAVLLYQAQDSADVFGAQIDTGVHQDVENKENNQSSRDAPLSKGKAPSETEAADVDPRTAHDEAIAAAAQEEEDAAAAAQNSAQPATEETDLQIAWENLDTARAIWERDPETNSQELAGVHVLLGDVGLENEAFENALIDYERALDYQKMAKFVEDDRRTAEVHFKRVMALQFLERPEDALEAVNSAWQILEKKLHSLQQESEKNKNEIEDVRAILDDLKEKKVELKDQASEKSAMAEAVKGALYQFQKAAEVAQKPSLHEKEHDLGTTNKSNISSPVKDLGVVGRGTKRINLAPVGTKAQSEGEALQGQQSKKPRSLEDLMGNGEDTTIGFGGSHGAKEKGDE